MEKEIRDEELKLEKVLVPVVTYFLLVN